jgi:hypothetical protein
MLSKRLRYGSAFFHESHVKSGGQEPAHAMMSKMRKALRLSAGFALLIAGGILALPGVPGPGIPLALLGLVLLSDHFAWANRTLAWARERFARLRGKERRDRSKPDGAPRTLTEVTKCGDRL